MEGGGKQAISVVIILKPLSSEGLDGRVHTWTPYPLTSSPCLFLALKFRLAVRRPRWNHLEEKGRFLRWVGRFFSILFSFCGYPGDSLFYCSPNRVDLRGSVYLAPCLAVWLRGCV